MMSMRRFMSEQKRLGKSGRDLAAAMEEARTRLMATPVTLSDLLTSCRTISSSVNPADLPKFKAFNDEFGAM
jgi:hypothetical protein